MADAPEIYPDLFSVWSAFWKLSRARPSGMGVTAIPPSEIYAHMDERGVADAQDRADFYRLIETLDDEWMAWAIKKTKP